MMRFGFVCLGWLFCCTLSLAQQQDKYDLMSVAFYNIENLYDTIDDPKKQDEEFLPKGKNNWNSKKYYTKLDRLAEVITLMCRDYNLDAPMIVGLCEVENRQVLVDLVNSPRLKDKNYGIVHFDSPDERGVDVALLYRKTFMRMISGKAYKVPLPDRPTRDILVTTGVFERDTLTFLVNHWPSRRGGEKRSSPGRILAAKTARKIVDSVLTLNPKAKIMVMGDLNDTPIDESVAKHLRGKGDIDKLAADDMFNPMYDLHRKGMGTLAHADKWQIFDQIVLTRGLLDTTDGRYTYMSGSAKVFAPKFLKQDEGRFASYPFRTFVGSDYRGGYSDHFPVYILLGKKVQ